MNSIRLKITLLFLLVTIPLVLEILYQNRLAGGMAANSRRAHLADLALSRELTEVARLSQEYSQLGLQRAPGMSRMLLRDLESSGDRLAQMAPIERETKPLREAIAALVRAEVEPKLTSPQHLQRLNVIVGAEIRNLLVRLELGAQKKTRSCSLS
jgi:hypothetical protein